MLLDWPSIGLFSPSLSSAASTRGAVSVLGLDLVGRFLGEFGDWAPRLVYALTGVSVSIWSSSRDGFGGGARKGPTTTGLTTCRRGKELAAGPRPAANSGSWLPGAKWSESP